MHVLRRIYKTHRFIFGKCFVNFGFDVGIRQTVDCRFTFTEPVFESRQVIYFAMFHISIELDIFSSTLLTLFIEDLSVAIYLKFIFIRFQKKNYYAVPPIFGDLFFFKSYYRCNIKRVYRCMKGDR